MSEEKLVLPHRKQVMSVDGGGGREGDRDVAWTWERGVTRFANGQRSVPGEGEVSTRKALAWLPRGRRVLASEMNMEPDEEEQVWEQTIESACRLFCVRTATWKWACGRWRCGDQGRWRSWSVALQLWLG